MSVVHAKGRSGRRSVPIARRRLIYPSALPWGPSKEPGSIFTWNAGEGVESTSRCPTTGGVVGRRRRVGRRRPTSRGSWFDRATPLTPSPSDMSNLGICLYKIFSSLLFFFCFFFLFVFLLFFFRKYQNKRYPFQPQPRFFFHASYLTLWKEKNFPAQNFGAKISIAVQTQFDACVHILM